MKLRKGIGVVLAGALAMALVEAPPGGTARAAEPAAALSAAAAVNKAGRQRMLSQRLAKAYLMVALGVQPGDGRRILAESLSLFEAQFAELKSHAPNDDVKAAAAALEREWKPYRAVLAGRPDLSRMCTA